MSGHWVQGADCALTDKWTRARLALEGCVACKWMITLVRSCKLIYFGIYCACAGRLVLAFS